MAGEEPPRGAKRTAWNIGIALLVLAVVIALFIALMGGGGAAENESLLRPLLASG